jgi:hypothetical protein
VGAPLEGYATVAYRADGWALAAVGSHKIGSDKGDIISIFDITHGPNPGQFASIQARSSPIGALFSRDGGLLAVASPSGEVVLKEVGRRGLGRRLWPLPGFHVRVVRPGLDFFLSPRIGTFSDGGRLAISDGTGSVFVWSTSSP